MFAHFTLGCGAGASATSHGVRSFSCLYRNSSSPHEEAMVICSRAKHANGSDTSECVVVQREALNTRQRSTPHERWMAQPTTKTKITREVLLPQKEKKNRKKNSSQHTATNSTDIQYEKDGVGHPHFAHSKLTTDDQPLPLFQLVAPTHPLLSRPPSSPPHSLTHSRLSPYLLTPDLRSVTPASQHKL